MPAWSCSSFRRFSPYPEHIKDRRMNTFVLTFMLVTQVSVMAITTYFFYRVFISLHGPGRIVSRGTIPNEL